ncbi:MAG: Hsp20/alpha crystallin family protein [Nitrosomonadales bacterium]|nr:Hsp20/alpha crystallin family protein [Nitrosomonadales bacterium]
MSNLTRFNPFGETVRFSPPWDVDDMLDRFMMRPAWREMGAVEPQIKMDVSEAGSHYMVKAEIPGVQKDDIRVTIDGNLVSISAEVRQEKDVKEGEKVIRSERCYGKAMRSFRLDQEVDQDKAEAKYADGVLELTLPKKNGITRKELAVS